MEEPVQAMNSVEIVRWPISLKIFGIAIGLLVLMIIVTYSSSVHLRAMGRQLTLLTDFYIELDQLTSEIRAQSLIEVIQIERALHRKTSLTDDAIAKSAAYIRKPADCDEEGWSALSKQISNAYPRLHERQLMRYLVRRQCTNIKLALAAALVDRAMALPQLQDEPVQIARFATIKTALASIAPLREQLQTNVEKYLREAKGDDDQWLVSVRTQIDTRRQDANRIVSKINRVVHEGTREAALESQNMEQRALWLSWSVTLAACVSGLLVAYFLTRSLVRPVRELVALTKAIRAGNLDVQINIKTSDEIEVLADSFGHMVGEMRQKEAIKSMFGKYVDPRIVQSLLHDQLCVKGGERRSMTVFFSDLENFTTVCEDLAPEGAVKLLNHYFSLMAEAIRGSNGIIDKYIGDAIMAFWGPPFSTPAEHAAQACFSALEQQARMPRLQTLLSETFGNSENHAEIRVRIGIATGDVIVGSVGSDDARSFTVIGDNVNLASRLEGVNKLYGTQILISGETRRLAGDLIEAREIDAIRVKGRSKPVRVFELLGRPGGITAQAAKVREHYEGGLQYYRSRQWAEADAAFQECLRIDAADKPSQLFLLRVESLRARALPEDWDGVWTMTEK